MKTIGLVGGTSWESTAEYYRILNQETNKRLGKLHSAKIILYSVDFEPLVQLAAKGDIEDMAALVIEGAKKVERGGADFLLLCANTLHKVAPEIQKNIGIPLLHIVDCVAQKINGQKLKKVALLGTAITMEDGFYQERMKQFGIETIIPEKEEREFIHASIFKELCLGKLKSETKQKYLTLIEGLIKKGVEGIILGCTEIPLLIQGKDCKAPLFDTTKIHALAAVREALQ